MNLIRSYRSISSIKRILLRCYSQSAVSETEYTETPEYPPIFDMSLQARKLRERQALHEKIKKLNTVEEKQIAINMPRYYGWRCVMFHEDKIPYNALPLVQCYTRTHFKQVEELPGYSAEIASATESVVNEIKTHIEEAICLELNDIGRKFTPSVEKPESEQKADFIAKNIVRQINRIIMNNLADKVPHLLSAQVDYEPRHEASWFVGGIDVPKTVINWRKQYFWMKDRKYENVDRVVQYLGSPFISIRNRQPLKPIIPYTEADNPEFKVEKYTYRPESTGYFSAHRHATNMPGFWPGDSDEFGLLSIHGRGHILSRKDSYGLEDNMQALHCQAIKASFGWLLAQANYQGFTTYNDLIYPLVTQTVLTDGQLWSFYNYQLNTITMHNEQMDLNSKNNVCFGTQPLKLYDCIENGKIKGLNESVLKHLIQMYLNVPEEREYNMKPFLGEDERIVADIEDDQKRCWLEKRYKVLVSNRPRHLLLPEIHDWERIFKIYFKTRVMEKKTRPFELHQNPFKRKLSDHLPPYIPKNLRPYPKARKFEKMYYPDV